MKKSMNSTPHHNHKLGRYQAWERTSQGIKLRFMAEANAVRTVVRLPAG